MAYLAFAACLFKDAPANKIGIGALGVCSVHLASDVPAQRAADQGIGDEVLAPGHARRTDGGGSCIGQ